MSTTTNLNDNEGGTRGTVELKLIEDNPANFRVDWADADELNSALKYVGFDAKKIREDLNNDVSTDRANVVKLVITYLNVGNAVDRLTDQKKVKELRKAKEIAKLLADYKVKKGKNVGKYTLSQIAQAMMPVTLMLACKYKKLDDPCFKVFFTGVPEYDRKMEEFDKGLSEAANRSRKEGQLESKSSTDWTELQRKGMEDDGVLCYYLRIASALCVRSEFDTVLLITHLMLNGEQPNNYDVSKNRALAFNLDISKRGFAPCQGTWWDLGDVEVKRSFAALYDHVMKPDREVGQAVRSATGFLQLGRT